MIESCTKEVRPNARLSRPVDRRRVDHRLVTLNVHDDRAFGQALGNLCDPVAAGRMLRRGQNGFVTRTDNYTNDPFVIGRHDNAFHGFCIRSTLRGVKDQRLSTHVKQ